jgi:hypothetical protein
MFPEETLHCVEWAKEYFGTWFTLQPQNFNKLFGDFEINADIQAIKNAKKALKMAQHAPADFTACIFKARKKFQSFFTNKILQLVHVYPLDKLTAEGRPFWSLPKRAPKIVEFDPKNLLHASFISSFACL